MKKSNIVFIVIHAINVLFLALIASGITNDIENKIFEIYFILSFTIIPIALMVAQSSIYKANFDIEKDKYMLFIPNVALCLIMIIFGIKYTIMLDSKIIALMIASCLIFIAVEVVLIFIFKKKEYTYKRNLILYGLSYLTLIAYLGLTFYLSYYFTLVK